MLDLTYQQYYIIQNHNQATTHGILFDASLQKQYRTTYGNPILNTVFVHYLYKALAKSVSPDSPGKPG